MKKILISALLVAATTFHLFGQPVKGYVGPTEYFPIPRGEVVEICGATPAFVYESNQIANSLKLTQRTTAQPAIFTPQSSFPAAQVITCGRFRLYYEDLLQTPADGFNHPTLGAARRATFCAALTYIQNTFNINVNGTTEFIDLYIDQSWSPSVPAPNIGYLAAASTYNNPASGFATTPGYYPGNVFLHATSGIDPQANQYDGHIIVNFHQIVVASITDPISYWNDYQNTTTPNCGHDLYSVLLHEVGHTLGFWSAVTENAALDAICGIPNNTFSQFDNRFLYHSTTPCNTGTLTKVVTGASPTINPAVSGLTNELRSNALWTRNTNVDQNHPVYSGTLDGFYPLMPASLCSHLAGNILANTAQSQYAPGFQSNYVMGPSLKKGQRKREWTYAEIRMFLTLGYGLNPTFAASTSLNGVDANGWLMTINSPAYRTNCTVPMLSYGTPYSVNPPYNFMELMTPDVASLVNNNTPTSPNLSQVVLNVASLASIADAQGDAIRVMPNSLFGIRGVSVNGNNHNAVVVNAAGTQFTYTPEPGFRGRAQFGFYLWDGHERGAFRIVSIDVVPGAYTVAAGGELIMQGGFEDGSEIRRPNLNPTIENSTIYDFTYEGVFAAHILSGSHPFNIVSNWWNLAGGDMVQDSWYDCSMGGTQPFASFGSPFVNWNTFTTIYPQQYPTPPVTALANDRYHPFQGPYNYSILKNPVGSCNVYEFECDLNFERTGFSVGQTFSFQLQFVDAVSPTYHTVVHYSLPVNVVITTTNQDTWQHVVVKFQYCGTPSSFMNLKVQGIVAAQPPVLSGVGSTAPTGIPSSFTAAEYPPFNLPYIDNVSLNEITPAAPLVITATQTQLQPNCVGPATLTAVPLSFIPCNATYTWNPGNLVGNQVVAQTTVTTTYSVACSSALCSQIGSATVVVPVAPSAAWPQTPTGTGREFWSAVNKLPSGDLVGAGTFTPDITFAGGPTFTVTNNGLTQLFVIRYNENCGSTWVVQFGNQLASETVNDIAVDASGNIFITGNIGTTTTFGTFTIAGPAAYVVKLNGNTGAVMTVYGSTGNGVGKALAIDGSGNVYLTGHFLTTIKFGALATMTSVGNFDGFVVRFNNTLTTPTWSTRFGTPAYDYGIGVGLSSTGDLYVGANIGGTMTLGTNTFTNSGAGTDDVFVGRFTAATGAYINGSGRMEGNATNACTMSDMIVDAAGNVYFTGMYRGTFTTLAAASSNDAYISCWLATSLANNWIRTMGGPGLGSDLGSALAFDGIGNIYATGTYNNGSATFAGFTPATLSGGNTYVVKLSTTNVPAFAATSANTAVGSGSASECITALTSGNAFVGGNYAGSIAFGTQAMTSVNTNAFLTRLSGTGAFVRLINPEEESEAPSVSSEQSTLQPDAAVASQVQLYPNPTTGEVFLQFATAPESTVQLQVFDTFGKLIEVNQTRTGNLIRLDMQELLAGVYLIRIVNGDQVESKRVMVIQH